MKRMKLNCNMMKPDFDEWVKNLPMSLDGDTVVWQCWNFLRFSLTKAKHDSERLPLLIVFARARNTNLIHTLSRLENSAMFEKLLIELEDLYFPLMFLLFDRLKFHLRKRGVNETAEEFLNAIENLAATCEFGKEKGMNIKKQFLHGGNLAPSLKQMVEECVPSSLRKIIISCSNSESEISTGSVLISGQKMRGSSWNQESHSGVKTRKDAHEDVSGRMDDASENKGNVCRRSHRLVLRKRHQEFGNDTKNSEISKKNKVSSPKKSVIETKIHQSSHFPEFDEDKNAKTRKSNQSRMSVRRGEICRQASDDQSHVLQCDSQDGEDSTHHGVVTPFSRKEKRSRFRSTPVVAQDSDDSPKTPSCKVSSGGSDDGKNQVKIESIGASNHKEQSSLSTSGFPVHSNSDETGNARSESIDCKICREVFPEQDFYKKHLQEHTSAVCGKRFDFLSRLSKHLLKHTRMKYIPKIESGPASEKKGRKHEEYTCPECKIKICGKRLFNRHMNCHNLYCDICDKMINCKSTFEIHMSGHKGERPFPCDNCSRSFTRKSDLKVHQQVHNPNRQKSHVCDCCGKKFFRIHELERHRKLHTDERPFRCDICSKSFPTAHGLKCHRFLHTGVKTFTCEKCGLSFAQKSNLATHLMRHSGIKEHTCKVCGLKFARKCYLESHMRSHTKEKPFTCEECGACVSSRYSLQRHKLVHTGNKPYECVICKKAFTWQSTYKKHMESHGNTHFSKNSNTSENSIHQEPNQTLSENLNEGHDYRHIRPCDVVESVSHYNLQNLKLGNEVTNGPSVSDKYSVTASGEKQLHHQDFDVNPVQEQALNLQLGQKMGDSEEYVNQVPITHDCHQPLELERQIYLPQQQQPQPLYATDFQHPHNQHILQVQSQNLAIVEREFPQDLNSHSQSIQLVGPAEPRYYNWVIQGTNSSGGVDTIVLEPVEHQEGHQ